MLVLLVPFNPSLKTFLKYSWFLPESSSVIFRKLVCYCPHLLSNQYISFSFILRTFLLSSVCIGKEDRIFSYKISDMLIILLFQPKRGLKAIKSKFSSGVPFYELVPGIVSHSFQLGIRVRTHYQCW